MGGGGVCVNFFACFFFTRSAAQDIFFKRYSLARYFFPKLFKLDNTIVYIKVNVAQFKLDNTQAAQSYPVLLIYYVIALYK
jgi:hypothetical protein